MKGPRREMGYVQSREGERRRNSGNSIAEVKGNYKKVNVEEKSI